MPKPLYLLAFIFFTFILGVIAPKLLISNSNALTSSEIACGQRAASKIFDHPWEELAITKIAVAHKRLITAYGQKRQVVYINAHTLFGIKYGTVTALCKAEGLECASRVDDIWGYDRQPKNSQPCG